MRRLYCFTIDGDGQIELTPPIATEEDRRLWADKTRALWADKDVYWADVDEQGRLDVGAFADTKEVAQAGYGVQVIRGSGVRVCQQCSNRNP